VENGTWYPPSGVPEPLVSPPVLDPEGSVPMHAAEDDGCVHPDGGDAKPPEEVTPVRLRRVRNIRLGSELERGVWMWLIIIGAIVLIVLMIIAVSQVRSNLPKGREPAAIERMEIDPPVTSVHSWLLRSGNDCLSSCSRGAISTVPSRP